MSPEQEVHPRPRPGARRPGPSTAQSGRILAIFVAVLLVAAFGLMAYVSSTLRRSFDERTGQLEAPVTRYEPPAELGAFPYDRSGKTVVIEVRAPEGALPADSTVPVLWIRGTRAVVGKRSWTGPELDYETWRASREGLENTLVRLTERAAVPVGVATEPRISIVLRGLARNVELFVDATAARALLAEVLEGDARESHVPRALRVSLAAGPPPRDGESVLPWPLHRLPIDRVLSEGEVLSRGQEANALLIRSLAPSALYETSAGPKRIRLDVVVDGS